MGDFALGQPVPRFEDPRLLRGGGRYVDDMVLPRMVFGHVLRSPFAHARISSVDVARARAAPGVLAVLTGADWQNAGWGDLPVPDGMRRRDGAPMYRPRFPALAEFYYREVLSRLLKALRGMLRNAHERGELKSDALVRFPMLLGAPGIIAIVWSGLFERFEPLDVRAMMRAYFNNLFGAGRAA